MRFPCSPLIGRIAAVACCAFLLGSAPVAFAVPADQRTVPHRTVRLPALHLTPSQLRAIDGHQPVDPPIVSARPPSATPLTAAGSGSSTPNAWVLVLLGAGVAVCAAVGFRLVTHRPVVPRRTSRIGV